MSQVDNVGKIWRFCNTHKCTVSDMSQLGKVGEIGRAGNAVFIVRMWPFFSTNSRLD
jgi:hypothetical protein